MPLQTLVSYHITMQGHNPEDHDLDAMKCCFGPGTWAGSVEQPKQWNWMRLKVFGKHNAEENVWK
jgi:hypothetical protein